ncbi:hypothetical protein SSS_03356 [Sarcoptes scabiei]|uniref:Uncharacterized protein n=1 Tax=Sarcoptes scabiei TaxID=52283 RepID=A0A834RHW1_SARSC|nr:hypothetical protein SSS_03356 [Sarcoptes scabiei]
MSNEVPSDIPFEDILLSFNELLDKLGTLRRRYLSNHQLRSDHIQSMLGIESTLDHTRAVCIYADVSIRRNMFSSGSVLSITALVISGSAKSLIKNPKLDPKSKKIFKLNPTILKSSNQFKKFLRLINKRSKSNSKMSYRNHDLSLETLNLSYDNLITKLAIMRSLVLRNLELPIEQIQWFIQIEHYLENLKDFLACLASSIREKLSLLPPSFRRDRLIRLNTRFHRTNLAHHRSRMQIIHLLDAIDPSHTDQISVRAVYSRVERLANESLQFYQEILPQI